MGWMKETTQFVKFMCLKLHKGVFFNTQNFKYVQSSKCDYLSQRFESSFNDFTFS